VTPASPRLDPSAASRLALAAGVGALSPLLEDIPSLAAQAESKRARGSDWMIGAFFIISRTPEKTWLANATTMRLLRRRSTSASFLQLGEQERRAARLLFKRMPLPLSATSSK